MHEADTRRAVLVVLLVLLVVALLAYARGAPGDDGRTPGTDIEIPVEAEG